MTHTKYDKAFNLYVDGPDTDYGPMRQETVRVIVEQSWPWDDEQIKDMKEHLSDFYDVPSGRVQTDEEAKEEDEYWTKQNVKL